MGFTETDYLDEDDNDSNASFATRSTASSTSKRLRNNLGQGIKVQSSMNNFIRRKVYPNEMDTFYRLLLRMTISNGWAFQWVENKETIEFFNFISPLLQLPNRKTLADEILKDTAESVQKNIETAAKEDNYGVSISLDG